MKTTRFAILLFWSLTSVTTAQAELFNRGGGMIYDSDLDVTWLQDWNQAKTSNYDSDGFMTWSQANNWAEQLDFGGHTDWRLPNRYIPNMTQCNGSGCSGELYHLWIDELGNPGGSLNVDQRNKGEFLNLYLAQNPQKYWSSTEGEWSSSHAYYFAFLPGWYGSTAKTIEQGAVAVRSGDVLQPVPEPTTLLLSLLGVAGLLFIRKPHVSPTE